MSDDPRLLRHFTAPVAPISPLDYGAVSDGITDDTSAVQAYVDAVDGGDDDRAGDDEAGGA